MTDLNLGLKDSCTLATLYYVTLSKSQTEYVLFVSCRLEVFATAHTYGDLNCCCGSVLPVVLPENVSSCHISLHPLRDCHATQQQADIL